MRRPHRKESTSMSKTAMSLDPRTKEQIIKRLRSVEGHLRGIVQMIAQDRYCIDVLKQTKAVRSAINRVDALILERHLNHCVSAAIRSDDPGERVVGELLDVFENTGQR
jgi:DNA-binding FrmR family transcriptional regulator